MSQVQRFRLLFSALMSMAMSGVLAAWGTFLRGGFAAGVFLSEWAHAFATGWPAAFAAVLVLAPLINRASQWLLALQAGAQREHV